MHGNPLGEQLSIKRNAKNSQITERVKQVGKALAHQDIVEDPYLSIGINNRWYVIFILT